MQFVLATGNEHKATEISGRLPDVFSLVTQGSLGIESVPETAGTFVENALIKARHAARESALPAMADDSGICVAALDGKPGIYSARYAGEAATDEANVAKLLAAMDGIEQRRAWFHCVLTCLLTADDPAPLIATGSWYGVITRSPRGSGGFGYDPVFLLPDQNRTAAELNADEKHQISHRGIALRQLAGMMLERYAT